MSDAEKDSNQISKLTTPTWEMELLISGATVFSLLQLPAPLYGYLSNAGEMHGETVYQAIKIFSIYVQFSLWILIVTFVLHLFMRGYWIALVGMSSVFPKGIQWEKLSGYGPIYKKNLEENNSSMSELIEIADNRATVVFGLGFGISLTMILLSVLLGLLIAVLLAMQVFGINAKSDNIIVITLGLFMLPYLFVYSIDKYFGTKLVNGKMGTGLGKMIGFYNAIGFGRSSILINLYRTNQSRHKAYLMFALMTAMGVGSMLLLSLNRLDGGAYDALPSSGRNSGLEAPVNYYASLREQAGSQSVLPYIESPVSSGPYLRLFVPYVPRRYNEVLQKQCPQALVKKAANLGEGLSCLSKLLAISIDGKLMPVDLMASSDPQTGQRGMMAMIPIETIESGKHELSLVSLKQNEDDEKPEKANVLIIPFWK
ncbi:MAG: hypothetical protein ABI644_13200 [Arenimonas sp.]